MVKNRDTERISKCKGKYIPFIAGFPALRNDVKGAGTVRWGRKAAFTLAEVLITLGIIGIVATLTIPTLVSDYKKKVYVVQLQKVYNQLSHAAVQFMADQRADSLADTYLSDGVSYVGPFLNTYFHVAKDCGVGGNTIGRYAGEIERFSSFLSNEEISRGTNIGDMTYVYGSNNGCLADSYSNLDGSNAGSFSSSSYYCVLLNTGASICMTKMGTDSGNGDHGSSDLVVDVNGKNGPNRAGRDLFAFSLYSDGKIAESYVNDNSDRCLDDQTNVYGGGCFTKIMTDGWKMDY